MTLTNFNPHGLTQSTILKVRPRTMGGETIYYHTYFEPVKLDRVQRRNAIDTFKHPETEEDKIIQELMIEYVLDEFFKVHNINEFDIIGGIHSSSKVVRKILNSIERRYPNRVVIPELISKTRMRNTFIKQGIINNETSLKTKELVPKALEFTRAKHYDKVARVSLFPTRFRRYVGGFLKISPNIPIHYDMFDFRNKRVLLIDDTIGEGLTLCESSRLLKPYVKSLLCFTVMKDYCNKNVQTKTED